MPCSGNLATWSASPGVSCPGQKSRSTRSLGVRRWVPPNAEELEGELMKRDEAATKKLEEIRSELLSDPSTEELQKMQLQVGLLANIDLLVAEEDPGHHHDHMDDHDHANVFLAPIENIERQA
jgi:hypothetical protein